MNPTRVAEELLIRFDDVGAVRGVHFKEIDVYWKADGTVDFRRDVDPRPISLMEAVDLLGEASGPLVALATAQRAEIEGQQAEIFAVRQALTAEQSRSLGLEEQIDFLMREREALQERLSLLSPAAG
ncbi:hypothetical protein EOD42_14205 [Rhodovarius crocodyli]|uniref:Uncharacterized protein n=1 Tax=Rhodovarius crocodyli TaxID=1979269 RepID=A0A437MF19_9PROT|nr:hypothetical protein [Rhodovarius crocodyli]RVT96261.1 hypothetical protein EOD42_14205 [Rhodovarius crocodyli]